MEEKRTFKEWVKAHKREIILAGVSITAVIGILAAIKNKNTLLAMWQSLEKKLETIPSILPETELMAAEPLLEPRIIELPAHRNYAASFDVSPHIRNLSGGRLASAEKIATAAEHNFALLPGQTWVEGYTKGCVQAA